MKAKIESFNGGSEAIGTKSIHELIEIVNGCSASIAPNQAVKIRRDIASRLSSRGWSGKIRVSPHSNITITSQKSGVGLCLQVGNVARMYADIMKLQTLYADGNIKAAVLMLPTEETASILGSNLANAARLARELKVFSKVITLPLIAIGLEEG